MKKIISIVCLVVVIVSLVSCQSETGVNSDISNVSYSYEESVVVASSSDESYQEESAESYTDEELNIYTAYKAVFQFDDSYFNGFLLTDALFGDFLRVSAEEIQKEKQLCEKSGVEYSEMLEVDYTTTAARRDILLSDDSWSPLTDKVFLLPAYEISKANALYNLYAEDSCGRYYFHTTFNYCFGKKVESVYVHWLVYTSYTEAREVALAERSCVHPENEKVIIVYCQGIKEEIIRKY